MKSLSAAKRFRGSFSPSNLNGVYASRVAPSRAIGLDRVDFRNFQSRLASETNLISNKVLTGKYKFTRYKERLVSKGAGKAPRILSIPTIRDRLTQRTLCEFLFEVFPEAKPALPQERISALASEIASEKYKFFIKIDLKEFYPSIPHDRLIAKLGVRARLPQFKAVVRSSLTTPTVPEIFPGEGEVPKKGVPQGLSISNVLAEIYMLDVDRKIAGLTGAYFRFVDDIVVLTNSDPESLCNRICEILRRAKLVPHALGAAGSKTRIGEVEDGFDFLGYSMRPKVISIRESSIRAFESSLVAAFTEYKHRLRRAVTAAERVACHHRFLWMLNVRLTGCIFRGKRFGWIFYFSQINDLSVLRRIDNTVTLLLKRFGVTVPPKPKRALKAFYESKRKNKSEHFYIPNYDEMTIPMIRAFLTGIGINVGTLPDSEVQIAFNKVIRRATRKLEEDVSHIS